MDFYEKWKRKQHDELIRTNSKIEEKLIRADFTDEQALLIAEYESFMKYVILAIAMLYLFLGIVTGYAIGYSQYILNMLLEI